MIKPFEGYEAKKSNQGGTFTLPAGAYVAKILRAKAEEYSNGSTGICLYFDIDDGEFKGFFDEQYKNNNFDNKKWKGIYRLYVPQENSQFFDSTLKTFNNAMWAIENSNPKFVWEWDETKLKGKKVAVVFRNKEWEMDGKTGWTTECAFLASIDDLKNGKIKPAKDKPLKNKPVVATAPTVTAVEVDDDDLPF